MPQRRVQFPGRPRIESKLGFDLAATPVAPPMHISDNEQNTRNDNSNYDSLVGSLKSDTLNWKDHQSTVGFSENAASFLIRVRWSRLQLFQSEDEASDAGDEKEIEKNLMLQKEQVSLNVYQTWN